MPWTEVQIFREWFYRAVDSWFSADIACCDSCYDEFIAIWPYAYDANDAEFQSNGIPLDCLYSGSRLPEIYSRDDFNRLVKEIECPRCGADLIGNIWAYELPFDIPDNFENTVREIADIASRTPFLLLEHPFCQDILRAIKELIGSSSATQINTSLYRGRSSEKNDVTEEIASFDFPPKRVVEEGRYNHAGNSSLYLASDADTCVAELRNTNSTICEFFFEHKLHILDLVSPFDNHEKSADLLNALVYSALVSAKQPEEGFHKPHYVVSRFVADCAKLAGFHAIKYPSTRMTKTNFNLVLLNPELTLEKYAKVVSYHHHARKID